MAGKKGQANGAAAFIALLTILIILYILFLPPDVRTELLGDKNPSVNNTTTGINSADGSILFRQNIGRVNYLNTNERVYDLPATRIYSPTAAQILKSVPGITITHALLDSEKSAYQMDFSINKDSTKNVLLSFNVNDHKGPLSITLNGHEIYSGELISSNPAPLHLDPEYLQDENTLIFYSPSPGLAFWNVNKYALENIQITGDVTDYSSSEATQFFTLTAGERDNIQSIRLYFYPNCVLKDVSALKISLNGRVIYNSVADCGTRTFAVLSKDDVIAGPNELRFSSNKGSYTLDNMYIRLDLDTPSTNTYYFDLKDDYFASVSAKARCGDYDGVCPSGCDAIQDADCCFGHDGFWCALPTLNANDRCRFYVGSDDCTICKTGYYDSSGNPPTNCEDKCSDNTDNTCLGTCLQPAKYYDKDCCFASSNDTFWCKEAPITGINDKCKVNIAPTECSLCPSGYVNHNGAGPSACDTTPQFNDNDEVLLDSYEVKFTIKFVEDKIRKRVDINLNGHTFTVDTTQLEYSKVINDWVQQGTNSIEILPREDIDIAEMKVTIRQVR
jgi:hypothetical protein